MTETHTVTVPSFDIEVEGPDDRGEWKVGRATYSRSTWADLAEGNIYMPGVNEAARAVVAHIDAWTEAQKPKLPTEPGSVIIVKKYAGLTLEPPVVARLDEDGDWYWLDQRYQPRGHEWAKGYNIGGWTGAKVVEVRTPAWTPAKVVAS